MMRLYRKLSDFPQGDRKVAIAIGNFDGFHLGHQAVVAKMMDKARKLGLESSVMVFEPQPMEFFGQRVPARLFNLRDKLRTFQRVNVDNVFCMSFSNKFSAQTDIEFVSMLKERLHVQSITVGSQFNFGKGGKYNFTDLKRCCDELGIECSKIDKVEIDGVRVSSTLIRSLVHEGDFDSVTKYLDRPYTITGRVVHGNEIGRTLGFPTANVNLNRRVCPLRGVYAVKVKWNKGEQAGEYKGVANVGFRPTIADPNNKRSLLEVNILDFNGDIYGKELEVSFIHKIRDEQKFGSLDELVKQITIDKQKAIELLATM